VKLFLIFTAVVAASPTSMSLDKLPRVKAHAPMSKAACHKQLASAAPKEGVVAAHGMVGNAAAQVAGSPVATAQ